MADHDDDDASKKLMTEERVAELLGVRRCTVANERKRGNIECTMAGARIRYSPKQYEEYLERRRVKATCVGEFQSPDNRESTPLRKNRVAGGQTIPIAANTTKGHQPDKFAISALARQILRKRQDA